MLYQVPLVVPLFEYNIHSLRSQVISSSWCQNGSSRKHAAMGVNKISSLERVAEELMGRRKWELYQDIFSSIQPRQEAQQDFQEPQRIESSGEGAADSPLDTNLVVQNNSTATSNGRLSFSQEETKSSSDCNVSSKSEPPLTPRNCCKLAPVDWKPEDKCNFCDNGRLLGENEPVELVPTKDQAVLKNPTILGSDSDSSEDGSDNINSNFAPPGQRQSEGNPTQTQLKMTSLESVVAAVASMHGIPAVSGLSQFYPSLWFANSLQTGTDGGSSSSSNGKPSSSVNCEGGAEQPLDLSAKSSSSSGGVDQKNIFKAKPRMTTISGRRTYTEDELQNALQDILSGKLGTRRAAVLYGIPRSTLRNKVYKLAIENKREPNVSAVAPVLADLDDDDRDCSGAEEEKEVENTLRSLPSEDIFRLAAAQGMASFQKMGKMEDCSTVNDSRTDMLQELRNSPSSSKPQTPALPTNMMDPNIILQGLILSGALSGFTNNKNFDTATLGMIPELFKNILLHNELLKSSEGRTSKSETPETSSVGSTGRSGSEHNDNVDDLHIKVPSFKSISGAGQSISPSSPPSGLGLVAKNGESASNCALSSSTTSASRSSPQSANILGIPTAHTVSESSGSPPMGGMGSVSLRDVIAKSISKSMQPPLHLDLTSKKTPMDSSTSHGVPSLMDHYKWSTISVKKGLGAELSRFGGLSAPASNMLSNNSALNSQLNNSTGTGGKGTRPKRGKYRNYDRDSLVEAVKAVQRGEMSVHRAGSYYGVPHSTLEYKVKERHLMRPRKREPKPQPLDVERNSSGTIPAKSNDISNASVLRSQMEKSKLHSGPGIGKPPMKTPTFDPTSPNGHKSSPFLDSATMAAAQLQYQPQLFWSPPNFPGMSLDFSRTALAAAAAGPSSASTTASPFPSSEDFFASHMRQRFPDQGISADNAATTGSSGNSSRESSIATAGVTGAKPPGMGNKLTREFAESLYEGASGNGSLLDGIIRRTLDKKSGDMHHGALLDQLVKKNLQYGNPVADVGFNAKRSASSPLNYGLDIKRERASPSVDESREDHPAEVDEDRMRAVPNPSSFDGRTEPGNGSANNNMNICYNSGSNSDAHSPGEAPNIKPGHAILSVSDDGGDTVDSS